MAEYTYNWNEIADRLDKYIDDNEQPFIQEFCLNEKINRANFYEQLNSNKKLADTHKKALDKQELYILKNAPTGKYNPVFGIFRLKQPAFGYVDKVDQNINLTAEVTAIPAAERQARIDELTRKRLGTYEPSNDTN